MYLKNLLCRVQGVPSARGLGWVDLNFVCCLPNSAWADGNLAEAAGQMGKKVEHPNQSQPNPGPLPDESPCIDTRINYKVSIFQLIPGIRLRSLGAPAALPLPT